MRATTRPIVLAALLACAVGCTAPAAAHALTPVQITKRINQLRTANGIPALEHSATYAARCAAANRYAQRNGVLTHQQEPGKPGYTKAGAWAALNAPLAQEPWERDLYGGNPWSAAPYHVESILNPYMRVGGGAEAPGGYQCFARTDGTDTFDPDAPFAPALTAPQDTLYHFPGGTFAAPWGEQQYEAPRPLSADLGLRGPQFDMGPRTGPTIIMWWVGPEATYDPETQLMLPKQLMVTRARLTGPGGAAVRTKFRAAQSPTNPAYLLPVRPLAPRATYRVHVALSSDPRAGGPDRTWSTTFTFRTSGMVVTRHGVSTTWPAVR